MIHQKSLANSSLLVCWSLRWRALGGLVIVLATLALAATSGDLLRALHEPPESLLLSKKTQKAVEVGAYASLNPTSVLFLNKSDVKARAVSSVAVPLVSPMKTSDSVDVSLRILVDTIISTESSTDTAHVSIVVDTTVPNAPNEVMVHTEGASVYAHTVGLSNTTVDEVATPGEGNGTFSLHFWRKKKENYEAVLEAHASIFAGVPEHKRLNLRKRARDMSDSDDLKAKGEGDEFPEVGDLRPPTHDAAKKSKTLLDGERTKGILSLQNGSHASRFTHSPFGENSNNSPLAACCTFYASYDQIPVHIFDPRAWQSVFWRVGKFPQPRLLVPPKRSLLRFRKVDSSRNRFYIEDKQHAVVAVTEETSNVGDAEEEGERITQQPLSLGEALDSRTSQSPEYVQGPDGKLRKKTWRSGGMSNAARKRDRSFGGNTRIRNGLPPSPPTDLEGVLKYLVDNQNEEEAVDSNSRGHTQLSSSYPPLQASCCAHEGLSINVTSILSSLPVPQQREGACESPRVASFLYLPHYYSVGSAVLKGANPHQSDKDNKDKEHVGFLNATSLAKSHEGSASTSVDQSSSSLPRPVIYNETLGKILNEGIDAHIAMVKARVGVSRDAPPLALYPQTDANEERHRAYLRCRLAGLRGGSEMKDAEDRRNPSSYYNVAGGHVPLLPRPFVNSRNKGKDRYQSVNNDSHHHHRQSAENGADGSDFDDTFEGRKYQLFMKLATAFALYDRRTSSLV